MRCGTNIAELLDYVEGQTATDTMERLRSHLEAGCPSCERNLAWMRRVTGVLREAELYHVPEHALSRANALFRSRYPRPLRVPTLAQLVFDSRRGALPTGARGEDPTSVQLLYGTEVYDIDVWMEPLSSGGWYVIGQALPKDGSAPQAPDTVTLESEGEILQARFEGSEFHFPYVAEGTYTLRLGVQDFAIELSDIPIGPAQ